MSIRLRIIGLATIIGVCSTGASPATNSVDPQQRARDMIVPPPASHPPVTAGARGRLIESHEYVDPQLRAARLLSHDSWPSKAAHSDAARPGEDSGYIDPQSRARSMILGNRH